MTATKAAIDCDVHPAVPSLKALLPHFDDYWRNSIIERGIPGFETNSYPPKAPISIRQDWKGANGSAANDVAALAPVRELLTTQGALLHNASGRCGEAVFQVPREVAQQGEVEVGGVQIEVKQIRQGSVCC
jgi:hypothetical protein